jgi:integrase
LTTSARRLAGGAGLRFGEATGLTVLRVESLRRRIQVLEQAQSGALAPLKSKASRRTIPVGDWVLDEIVAHLQRFGAGKPGTVMSNSAGRIVARNAFGDMWRRSVAAARTCGKPPAKGAAPPEECRDTCADPSHMLTGTHFHDLRHFYASALIDAGLNPKVIQSRMGHATIAETMDTYGHLFKDAEDAGRMAVDDALAKAQTAQARPRIVQ